MNQQKDFVAQPVGYMDKTKFKMLVIGASVTTTLTSHRAFKDDVALYSEVPSAPVQEPVAVPEGWHIAKADNGQVLVSAPNCDPGSAWIKNQGPLPQRILYALVGAMLDAPPPQPQPKQEPASVRERWNIERDGDDLLVCFSNHEKWESCEYVRYVRAPHPQREWVGLTDEDVRELDTSEFWDDHTPADFVRLVENKLREKNGGGV
jgi:hypothetical protein